MFRQLAELKTIAGLERVNFSVDFLASNQARVVITSKVNSEASSDLTGLLKRPIVVEGSLSDLDTLLINEIFNYSTEYKPNESAPSPAISDSPALTSNGGTESESTNLTLDDEAESL